MESLINKLLQRSNIVTCLIVLQLIFLVSQAGATETQIIIRARAVDAKFIGTGVGGLKVEVEDVMTGEVLDTGRLKGGTGNTQALMKEAQTRGLSPATQEAAGFLAKVDINEPRRLRFRLTGPLAYPQTVQHMSLTTWVAPGRHILGDGLVLHLPGLIVQANDLDIDGRSLDMSADVTMMCGCPITADGLWDADKYEVRALLLQEGKVLAEAPLSFTGQTNRFAGSIEAPEAGNYQLSIFAYQQDTGNTGAAKLPVQLK